MEKEQNRQMFNDIAHSYDKLNHILSLDIDKSWRRKAVAKIMSIKPEIVADLACGTGDFSIALVNAGVKNVVGYDISEGMLDVGKEKIGKLGLAENISMEIGDSEDLPLDDDSVDAVSVAFGVRNFEHKEKGLAEMHRVIRKGGMACILELSVPQNKLLLMLYKIYFLHILPIMGKIISGNNMAYKYLPDSVLKFPKPEVFKQMMRDAGFKDVEAKAFTFGLCRMFIGRV